MQPRNEVGLNIFKDEARWVNWRPVVRDGKTTKVPLGSSTDPATWKTRDKLDQSLGAGIVFMPDKLLLGIDIDHCLNDNLEIEHEQKETIERFVREANTYGEISPSGSGLHLFLGLSAPLALEANRRSPYEIYNAGRYFTVTDRPFGSPLPVRTVSTDEAIRLLSLLGYPWKQESKGWDDPANIAHGDSVSLNDEEVLKLMFSSKKGGALKDLYDGVSDKFGTDESAADMAVCDHLAFWTGGNSSQIERLWLKSGLGTRKKVTDRKDYRSRTITAAIRACKEFYSGKGAMLSDPKSLNIEDDEIVFLTSSDIVSKPIDWLWKDKIAKGKVTLIAGDPGLGKSQVSLFLASIVSTGGTFPGEAKADQGRVILFSAEDDAEDTINPRLQACEADQTRVHIFSTVKRKGKDQFFDLSEDIDLLEKSLQGMKDVSLIVVDPITAFLGATDSHVNAEVRALLSKLSKIASAHRIAIVVVTHLNKSTGGSAMNKITGSLAFVAAARAAYMVIKDENDESRRLFLPVKNNLAEDKSGYAFSIESVQLGDIKTSRVTWEKDSVQTSVNEALHNNEGDRGGVSKATVDWLEEYLRKHPEGVTFDIICKEAQREGISKRTLYNAEKHSFIEKVYNGNHKPKIWKLVWEDQKGEEDTNTISADDIPI